MDETLGFDELSQQFRKMISELGLQNEMSDEEIMSFIMQSKEFDVYTSGKCSVNNKREGKTGTATHSLKSKKNSGR